MITKQNVQKFQSIVVLLSSITISNCISLSHLKQLIGSRKNYDNSIFLSGGEGHFLTKDGIDYIISIPEAVDIISKMIDDFNASSQESKSGSKNGNTRLVSNGIPLNEILFVYGNHETIIDFVTNTFHPSDLAKNIRPPLFLPLFKMQFGIDKTSSDFSNFLVGTGLFTRDGSNLYYSCEYSIVEVATMVAKKNKKIYRKYDPSAVNEDSQIDEDSKINEDS